MPQDVLPFSIAAKNAFRLANDEARRLNSSRLSTGHLLIGLATAKQGDIPCYASQLLESEGFTTAKAKLLLENRVGGRSNAPKADIELDHKLQHAMDAATRKAKAEGKKFLDTLDLLEAIALDRDSDACVILNRLIDLDPSTIRNSFDYRGNEIVAPPSASLAATPSRATEPAAR